jgi:uncharacterized membrane protein YuzA (DUF378 family)
MMNKVGIVARLLTVVGALNWGLVGIFRFDLVAAVVGRHFGETTAVSSAIYILVALAGIYELVLWKRVSPRPNRDYSPVRA